MKKYVVYRLAGEYKDMHFVQSGRELVAVEHGKNIHDVTDRLIQAVNADASGLEKYQTGYTALAYAPEPDVIEGYDYNMTVAMSPSRGELNDLIDYGVIVEKSAGE